ncbi:alcohol dehydrogenase catalytic domain-containing protein [Thiomonas bhubaneswarensis]|uniref:D-arabinose 1-dehydrogenase, Zn-dependent alcohol dehydrogenase family n=1 Tax=Thiomonas bhubaneswarensis TaxID=339866 RepID=A0A0K6I8M4_9BURK|nr:alcohol dehydrogenase catalytic domain-containing protein [Thiomonas bhubaneswarensis]CUA99403.1 D-arabinose 1-dehydrogenase, Zn-dependent alcohol dehydrogenase family [Thiomonas bhubaneswarensis]
MKTTYRAMQIVRPGVLELTQRDTPSPGLGQVLIAVEACGVCGADAADIDRATPAEQAPRVPGHEVVGRIVMLGEGVSTRWKIGQRVGVGRLGGHCNECEPCRQGRFQLCQNQPVVGSSCDGGYAEMLLARSTGLIAIPDELSSEEAAPILCAGIATFNALKKCGAQAGDTVAILGIGGLGHMALQYARRMGFRVVAIGRGSDIAADALTLGAHVYIDNREEDAVASLKRVGGAQAIVTTIDDAAVVSALLPALAPEGRLVVLNPGKTPLQVHGGLLVGGQRGIVGSITGTPYDSEKALAFSALVNVRPRIEVLPLEMAAEALRRLRSGEVRYRMVLTTG